MNNILSITVNNNKFGCKIYTNSNLEYNILELFDLPVNVNNVANFIQDFELINKINILNITESVSIQTNNNYIDFIIKNANYKCIVKVLKSQAVLIEFKRLLYC